MVECAVREAFEETGMCLLNDPEAGDIMQSLVLHHLQCLCSLSMFSYVLRVVQCSNTVGGATQVFMHSSHDHVILP